MARRVPFIPQIEGVECGAASLAMILAYWGHHAPLSEVRQLCGISRDGSRASSILGAARKYGLVARGYRTEPAALASCKGPAILHWGMNHFVVLERWSRERIAIVDPGAGPRAVPSAEFDKLFTGVCIELEPGPSFTARARAPSSARRYLTLLRAAGVPLAVILAASLALNVLAIVIPLTTQFAVDHVVGDRRADWLGLLAGSAALLVTFAALFDLARGFVLLRLREHLDVAMTRAFVAHLLELPIPFYAQRSLADLMLRVQANRTIRELLAGQSISLLADATMLVVYLALMLAFDVRLGAVVAFGGIVSVGIFLAAKKTLREGADDVQRKTVSATAELLQTLKGIATIKSAGVEQASRRRWLNAWIEAINATGRVALQQQAVSTLLFAIQVGVPVAIVALGGTRVLDGALTPGRLVAFQLLQAGFLGPLLGVVQTLVGMQVVPVLLARMDDVLDAKTEPTGSVKAPRLEGELALENVTFRYAPTAPEVLSEISLRIERGTKVALVGPSGSGKSTLARLLLGLYAPTTGRILVDGRDLAELDSASVRRQYGVVLQETALFDGTIADNLRLFYPNAPLEHLVQAARVAQIHDDIMALPRGYDTPIGTGGALSGGQRQRLALARAIVHRPPILVFDEATSALDAVTEAAIERYLSSRACTRIIIAHRLSTVRDADAIIVLDGGKIVERGRHDALVANGGTYARLVASGASAPGRAERPSAERVVAVAASELAAFEPFRGWSVDDRVALARTLERDAFEAGTRIVEQESRGAGLYLIVEGRVAIELVDPGLPVWKVAELGPGAIFGEIGLLDGSPSSASVVALGEVKALHLPAARFAALQRRGDVLAVRAALSLGAIVAARAREATRREAALRTRASIVGVAPPATKTVRSANAASLGETALAASLRSDEIALVEDLGERIVLDDGAVLYRADEVADRLFVLLAGEIDIASTGEGGARGEVLATIASGGIVAEGAVFDGGTHAATAIARGTVVAFAVPRQALVDLLLSGRPLGSKLIVPLAETLVRRFRFANSRLREAVALDEGEIDRAHAAREQALDAAREERDALTIASAGELPVVHTDDARRSAAACLVALLRATGRPVTLASVVEAFAGHPDGPLVALPVVARSLGFACRGLDVPLDELRAIRAPILAVLGEDERVVVLERHRRGVWRMMDPLRGFVDVPHRELATSFAALAFELRPESTADESAPLPQRVARFAAQHRFDLARLFATSLGLQGLTVLASLATALVVERVFPFQDRALLGVLVASAAAVAVASAILDRLQGRAIEHLRAHFDRELLDQLMVHLLELPIAFFDRFPPGEVMQRVQAFENVRLLFSTNGVAALLGVIQLLTSAVVLATLSPRALAVGALVFGLHAVVTAVLWPSLRRAAAEENAARGRQQDRLVEILGGIVTLRMAGDRAHTLARWTPSFLAELGAAVAQDRGRAKALPILAWARGLGLVVVVALGARDVLAGTSSLGVVVASLGVLATALGAMQGLASQILASAPSVVEYGLVRATFEEAREQKADRLTAPGDLRGDIVLENVSFAYTPEGRRILSDVSLSIRSGTKVALVGASGSGKSTLGRLLLGLYLPSAGRILFDGRDVTTLDLEALRRRMGVVLQEPFLLGGTLRDNIALAETGAPQERVVAAAERAAIHEDIVRMPMGYSTRVAEGGTTFSGGQRQRIVIARALLSTPAVLLLDEATSALDNLTQAAIEKNLSVSRATRIVIAHRLSTIADADCIVVLDKGRVVETGTHDELVARRGAYFALAEAELADATKQAPTEDVR